MKLLNRIRYWYFTKLSTYYRNKAKATHARMFEEMGPHIQAVKKYDNMALNFHRKAVIASETQSSINTLEVELVSLRESIVQQ